MDLAQLINNITPDIYQRLKTALEIGKWPDGRVLTQEQKELCMEAIIHYEHVNVSETEKTGYIDRGHKAEGEMCDSPEDNAQPSPLKWS